MINKLTKAIKILPSDADYTNFLSYPDFFALFQNIAVEQSENLNYDQSVLTPKGLFWVTSKYKLKIYNRPKVSEIVNISTWPEKPNRIRGRRNYTIEKDGSLLAEATSEWVIIDRNKNGFYLIDNLYDPNFEFCQERVLPEPFLRFSEEFPEEPFGQYQVRSIDIDFEGHMNNVNYIRALIGLFPRAELEKMNISEIECQYKTSCFEGDKLLWYKTQTEDGLYICARLQNNTVIFLARIC